MSYTITFFNNGYGQELASITNVVTIPELPTLEEEGFIFDGWFLDEELTNPATVGTELNSDMTLYACWSRERGRNNSNTYVLDGDLLGPDINITPGEPGLGGGGGSGSDSGSSSITSYYEGNSFLDEYYPSLAKEIFMDDAKYCNRRVSQVTASRFTFGSSHSYAYIPKSLSSEDTWVKELAFPFYYNQTVGNDATRTQLKAIQPGTKPTFKTKLFEWDGHYDPSKHGDWVVVHIYKSTNMLTFKVYNEDQDTLINTQYYTPAENIVDGAVPDKVILVLGSAGGGGSNGDSSYHGGGGCSGNAAAVVVNLINYATYKSDYPVLKVYIPTKTPAQTDGRPIFVTSAIGMLTGSSAGIPSYYRLFTIAGGSGATGRAGGYNYSDDVWVPDAASYGENSHWWKLKSRYCTNYDENNNFWVLKDHWLGVGGSYGAGGLETTIGDYSYCSGEFDPVSNPEGCKTSTTPGCYFYNSHYYTGSAGLGAGANNLNDGEYLVVGGYLGGYGNNGVGGGASLWGSGGDGGSKSYPNGITGQIAAGGGGARKGNTGGTGGGGYLAVYY